MIEQEENGGFTVYRRDFPLLDNEPMYFGSTSLDLEERLRLSVCNPFRPSSEGKDYAVYNAVYDTYKRKYGTDGKKEKRPKGWWKGLITIAPVSKIGEYATKEEAEIREAEEIRKARDKYGKDRVLNKNIPIHAMLFTIEHESGRILRNKTIREIKLILGIPSKEGHVHKLCLAGYRLKGWSLNIEESEISAEEVEANRSEQVKRHAQYDATPARAQSKARQYAKQAAKSKNPETVARHIRNHLDGSVVVPPDTRDLLVGRLRELDPFHPLIRIRLAARED